MTRDRILLWTLGSLAGVILVAQLVPYGRNHANPANGALVAWDSPATKDLAVRACYDCHSNQTKWPGYASIAPLSWMIQNHVDEGREKINFTAFDPGSKEVAEAAGEAGESVTEGEMPPWDYQLMHPEARLTPTEKQAIVAGLDATFAAFRKTDKVASAGGTAAVKRTDKDGDRD